MIEKDYKNLKELAAKFSGEFSDKESGFGFDVLQHFEGQGWVKRRPQDGEWLWRLTHDAEEALEEYEQELDAIKDRKAGNNIAKLALLISILSLLISATTIYMQYQ